MNSKNSDNRISKPNPNSIIDDLLYCLNNIKGLTNTYRL